MSRKKLLKLGISVLALNALGAAVYYANPDLQHVLTVYAADDPGEDEEIPDGEERQMALRFAKKLDALEGSIEEYKNLQDEDNKELLEADLEDATNYLPTAKAAMKSEEGKKGFEKYETRFNALKAQADALLGNKPADVITTGTIEVEDEIPYPLETEQNPDLEEGVTRIKQAGVKGKRKTVYLITYTNGKETKREKQSETVTQQPVAQITEVGTKKKPVETKETIVVEVKVPFKEETKEDPNLDKGQTRVEEGEEGIDEVTYEVTKVDGKETARTETGRTTKKAPKNKVTYTGTKPVVTTKEETETQEVDFQVKEVENPNLDAGVRRTVTEGVKGERTIVYTVTLTDGQETGRTVKSDSITKAPVDQVVEVGTKKAPVITTKEDTKTEEVDFQIKKVENPDLAEGIERVVTPGQKGVRTIVYTVTLTDGQETGRTVKSDSITKAPVDQVVEVGTKKNPVETKETVVVEVKVPFQEESKEDPNLDKGQTRVEEGEEGIDEVTYEVTKLDGIEQSRRETGRTHKKAPKNKVTYTGTKPVVTTKEETKTEEVDFQVKKVENPNLAEGVERVVTEGKKGERTIVYTVTLTDGQETGRTVKSDSITKAPVDQVVEVGTKKAPVITTKEETKTEEVDFQTKEVENPNLDQGIRRTVTEGKKGVRTIVETVTLTDGVETDRKVKSSEITTAPVDEVVEVGTKVPAKVETVEAVEENILPFEVTEVAAPDLPEGERRIVTPGKNGVETVVYEVTLTDGVETGRVEKSRTVTTAPVAEVVQIGTKKADPSDNTVEKDIQVQTSIPFTSRTVANPAYPVGYRKVVQPGWNGVQTTTYTVTYDANGNELGRVVKSTETTNPVEEVIEIGTATGPVRPNNQGNQNNNQNQGQNQGGDQAGKDQAGQDQNAPAKQDDQAASADHQAAGQGGKQTVTPQANPAKKEDKKALPNTGEANTGLLSAVGLALAGFVGFFRRKKN